MKQVHSCVLLVLVLWGVVSVEGSSSVIVNTSIGTIEGIEREQNREWLGVPYAKAPVGDWRWKAPEERERSTGILKTQMLSAQCEQLGFPAFGKLPLKTSEDCLYLNIYAPLDIPEGTYLPVMFYIPGGAFIVGTGNLEIYNASMLVNRTNIIVVTINYRVGALGFLASPEIFSTPGNFGLLDQIQAMKFVQKNIHQFQGDPNRVTIVGQSAGGQSIYLHLFSKLSSGLFSGAIMQSGSGENIHTIEYNKDLSSKFIQALSCTSSIASCLRSRSAQDILIAQAKICPAQDCWSPSIDNHFISEQPYITLYHKHQGLVNNVPVLIGSDKNDSNFLLAISFNDLNFTKDITLKEYILPYMKGELGWNSTVLQSMFYYYHDVWANYEDEFTAFARVRNDYKYICPVSRTLREVLLQGQGKGQLFWYVWDHVPSFLPSWWPRNQVGATHTTELGFIFDHPCFFECTFFEGEFTAKEQILRDAMMVYWTNFVKTGNPNNGEKVAVEWPAFDAKTHPVMQLGEDLKYSTMTERDDHCDFWDLVPYPLMG